MLCKLDALYTWHTFGEAHSLAIGRQRTGDSTRSVCLHKRAKLAEPITIAKERIGRYASRALKRPFDSDLARGACRQFIALRNGNQRTPFGMRAKYHRFE